MFWIVIVVTAIVGFIVGMLVEYDNAIEPLIAGGLIGLGTGISYLVGRADNDN